MDKNVMPEPQTVSYSVYYAVSENFVNDYLTCTSQMAYVDVMKVLNIINKHGNIISIAQLNDIIRTIGTFPYKYVYSLMDNVSKDDMFKLYFIKQPDGFNPGF